MCAFLTEYQIILDWIIQCHWINLYGKSFKLTEELDGLQMKGFSN
jgi:hypothetical protein